MDMYGDTFDWKAFRERYDRILAEATPEDIAEAVARLDHYDRMKNVRAGE